MLGLLPLVLLAAWRLTGKSDRNQTAIPVAALAGLLVVVSLVYFQIPRFEVKPTPADSVSPPDRDDYGDDKRAPSLSLGDYMPTPQEVVEKMLSFASVTEDDVVYDLGCGDGRILVTAAKKFGARGVGIDIDPKRVEESLENVKKAGVEDLVEIRLGDARNVEDIGRATVLALYILPEAAIEMRRTLEEKLAPGSRIVSHQFDFGQWEPHDMTQMYVNENRHLIYLWKIGETEGKSVEDRDPLTGAGKSPVENDKPLADGSASRTEE